MAKELQEPRLAAGLTRLFRLVGTYVPRLDELVSPVVVVGQTEAPPPVVRKATTAFFIPAVAGQFPSWRLETPKGIFLQIRRLWIAPGGNGHVLAMSMNRDLTLFPALGTYAARQYVDSRVSDTISSASATPPPAPAGQCSFGNTALDLLTFPPRWRYVYNGPIAITESNLGWVMGSDAGPCCWAFQFNVVNLTCGVSIEWDEFTSPQ